MVALLAPHSGYVPTTAAQRVGSGTMALAVLTALALALLWWRPVPAEPPLPEPPKIFRPLPAPPPPPVPAPLPARAKQPIAPDAPREHRPAPAPQPQPQPAAAAPVSLAPRSPDPTTVDITPVAIAPPVALPNLASGTGRGEAGRVGEAPGQGGGAGSGDGDGGSSSGGGGGSDSTLVRAQWAEKLSWDDIRPYHPKAVLAKGLSGRTTLVCRVRRNKRAEGCEVLSESPAGEGFGAAALAMERLYRIEPRRVNGKIIDNWRAFFTVNFYAKQR